jgi:hypothetical protein
MGLIQLKHPTLPDQPIEVAEESLVHYAAAGWVRADHEEPAPEAASADVPAGPPANEPEPSKRPRRISKESE